HRRSQQTRALVCDRNCGRMIFTAWQLQELHKSNGHIVLSYQARLTPMALDWLRVQRLTIGYSDGEKPSPQPSPGVPGQGVSRAKFLYWCDGPCGPAKAALAAEGRENDLGEIRILSEPGKLPAAV